MDWDKNTNSRKILEIDDSFQCLLRELNFPVTF